MAAAASGVSPSLPTNMTEMTHGARYASMLHVTGSAAENQGGGGGGDGGGGDGGDGGDGGGGRRWWWQRWRRGW